MTEIHPNKPKTFNKNDWWIDKLCKNQHRHKGEEKSVWRWRRDSSRKESYYAICVACKNESDKKYEKSRWDSPGEVRIAEKLIEKERLKPIAPDLISAKIGIPDILTESQVIEVKQGKNWKHAIGQVLVYRLYYPEHTARIHLFGRTIATINRKMIEEQSEKLNVKVSWDY